MPTAFTRFDRLSEDLATGKHNWAEHKFKLVLLKAAPSPDAESVSGPSYALRHSMARTGRTTSVSIEEKTLKAEAAAIGPFSAAAVVNVTTSAPIGFFDIGKEVMLEIGSSFAFKFPADVLLLTS